MAAYGYARVSSDGQSLEAQEDVLRAAGAQRIFAEKQSGMKTDRAALARCVASLKPGDLRGKGPGDAWADTTTPHGKLMVTILSGLSEFERHLILSRTKEGRTRAMARGVKFGRKFKLTNHQRAEAVARKNNGETLTEIAKSYNVSHMTISRL